MKKEVIGNATLFLGDCLEIIPTLEKVDAVITDPPFNVGKNYGLHNDSMSENEYILWLDERINVFRKISEQIWMVVPTIKLLKIWNLMIDANQVVIPMKAGYAIRSGWTQKYTSLLVEGKPSNHPWNLWEGIRHKGEGYFFREDTYNHPGYTPEGILERAVTDSIAHSVLDPFMGTGTTGVVCMNQGPKFIGIEIEEKYFQISCERIEQAQRQGRLFS